MAGSRLICVGEIVGVHGVRGLVRLRSFTADPAAIAGYGPLSDDSGRRRLSLRLVGRTKDNWLAEVEGIRDRTAAEALRGTRLHVPREVLPEPEEEEFYHADLIGLRAEGVDGGALGRVAAVHDFGGGTVLELHREHAGSLMMPFTRAVVPLVDLAGGRIVIDPPVEVEGEPRHDAEAAAEAEEQP
jgi:16S rRNA processing protein RimM